MKSPLGLKDDSGVNILLEYLFSLIVTVILFTILILLIGNIMDVSDHIALKEEYDIISNDVANRISAYSSEVYLNDQRGVYDSTVVSVESTYFDLPEPMSNKQYQVDVDYTPAAGAKPEYWTVKVSSTSDSSIYSTATFTSNIDVRTPVSFNSHQGQYRIYYDRTNQQIIVGYPE